MMNCRRRGRKKLFFDVTPNIRAPSVGGREASRPTLADRVGGSKLGHTSKQTAYNEKKLSKTSNTQDVLSYPRKFLIIWIPNVHHHIHNSPTLVHILSQTTPSHQI
jgi:hypothetical protein